MFTTFRETWASIRDTKYGNTIVKKTVQQAIWYWSKYVIVVMVAGALLALAAITYFVPQMGRLAQDNLPNISLGLKNGHVMTNVAQPFIAKNGDFVFIIDTKGSASELDKYPSGLLILDHQVITKNDEDIRTMDLMGTQDFFTSKIQVVQALSSHQINLWIAGVVIIVVLGVLGGAAFWLWQMGGIIFWSFVLWLGSRIIKRKLLFANALKIALYASVVSLIIQVLTLFSGGIFSLISLAAFLFFAVAWMYHLGK